MATQRTGTLRDWHDDRGFGFIAPTDGGAEVFVHVSAFAADGTRPTVGERLSFEVGAGRNGRPQALNVVRLAVGAVAPRRHVVASRPASGWRWLGPLAFVLFAGALAAVAYQAWSDARQRSALARLPAAPTTETQVRPAAEPGALPTVFRCDGRTRCTQMTSCAEATWFIQHCPGTQMDGNGDGVPCEEQWCRAGARR